MPDSAVMITGTDVSSWLHSLGYDARPMVGHLQIRGMQRHPRQYDGAEYRGPSTGGETRLYILGELPQCYQRNRRTVFRLPHDERDWYVAAYSVDGTHLPVVLTDAVDRGPDAHYPVLTSGQFRPFFILCPWSVPSGEVIDAHERSPYARVPCEWVITDGGR